MGGKDESRSADCWLDSVSSSYTAVTFEARRNRLAVSEEETIRGKAAFRWGTIDLR